jgi:PAS domain S-box-containing protein
VIVLTGKGSEEIAVDALKRGAVDYLSKTPAQLGRLPLAIEGALAPWEGKRHSGDPHRVAAITRLEREITERALVEAALRESEETLQVLLNASLEAAFLITIEGRVLWANEALAKRFGKTVPDLLGNSIYDFMPSEVSARRKAIGEEVVRTGRPVHFDDTRTDSHLANTVYPIKDPAGVVHRLAVISKEITQQVQAETIQERLTGRLRILHELDRAILKAQSPEEIAQAALIRIYELAPCQRASVGLFDPQLQAFSTIAFHTKDGMQLGKGKHVMLDLFAGEIDTLRLGKPYILADVDVISNSSSLILALREEGIRSIMNIPLLAQNKLIGSLNLGAEETNAFSQADIEIAEEVAASLAVAVHNATLISALRTSEERYRSLVETSPDSVTLTNLDLNILLTNQQTAQLFGYNGPENLVGKDALDLIAPEDRPLTPEYGQRAYALGELNNIEFTMVRQDRTLFPAELNTSLIFDSNQKAFAFILVIRDITQRVRAAEDLLQRAQELEALYKTSLEVNTQLDLPTLLNAIVKRASTLLDTEMGSLWLLNHDAGTMEQVASHNLPREKEVGQIPIGEGLVGRIAQKGRPLMVPAYQAWPGKVQRAISPAGRILGVPLKRGDKILGALTVFDETRRGEFDGDEIRLLELFAAQAAVAVDNATLYEAVRIGRERSQDLSRRLVDVQEAERRHLARELHDEIGQALTGLKLMLDSLIQAGNPIAERLKAAQTLVDELAGKISMLSLNLRPTMLDDLGLLPALVWHLKRFETQASIRINFEHSGLDRRFLPEVETAAYRIVQEGLTNVARYAQVDQVAVRLWTDEANLFVQIEDQGSGFDPEVILASRAASGLAGMQERALALGGNLEITSSKDAGTTLLAAMPIGKPGKSAQ